MRYELESGAWIDLRPVQDLKSRDRDVWDDAHDQAMGISATVAEDGHLDIQRLPVTPSRLSRLPRRALLCRLLNSWSYDGLPLPRWAGGIENEESLAEIPLEDDDEIQALLDPYVEKIRARPDPKGRRGATTTKSGNGSSATRPHGSRPDSQPAESGTAST